MRVLFVLAGDRSRASSRLRVYELLPYLQDEGIECEVLPATHFEDSLPGPDVLGYGIIALMALVIAREYDVVYLQKVPLPGPYIRVMETLGPAVVFDFDDALYASRPDDDSPGFWHRYFPATLGASSLVITGSDELSAYAKEHTDAVRCLPTAIPKEDYDRHRETETSNDDSVTIGWIGNPENLCYLDEIADSIAAVLDNYPEARLLVITAGDLPVEPLRKRPDVVYEEWTLETATASLSKADIGIRPLADDEWTRAKGGFTSVVEMMALGLPVVVPPVGKLSGLIDDGRSGYHATADEEWEEALSSLIEDNHRRDRMGNAAYRAVDEENFWTTDRAPQLIDALESL